MPNFIINPFTNDFDAVGSSGGGTGVVKTLTGDSGVATASANNINVLGSPSGTFTGSGDTLQYLDQTQLSPFVVSSISGVSAYPSIQAGIDAANAEYLITGRDQNVFVLPGIYTENLVLADHVNIIGVQPNGVQSNSSSTFVVRVIGVHTPDAVATQCGISFIFLESSSADIFFSNAAGTGTIYLYNVCINAGGGYTFNMSNWVGSIYSNSVIQTTGSGNGESNCSHLTAMTFINCQIGNNDPAAFIGSGTITIKNCVMSPESSMIDATLNWSNSTFQLRQQLNGSTNGIINNCYFTSSAGNGNLFFVGNSSFNIFNCTFASPAVPVWANVGSPTILISGCTFPNSQTMPTGIATLVYDPLTYGSSVNVAAADSPYTVGLYDGYLSVDSLLGAVTILVPDAPFADRIFTIKDSGLTASSNLITIQSVSMTTNFIADNSSVQLIINSDGGSFNLRYNATNTVYEVY